MKKVVAIVLLLNVSAAFAFVQEEIQGLKFFGSDEVIEFENAISAHDLKAIMDEGVFEEKDIESVYVEVGNGQVLAKRPHFPD